MPRYYEDKPEGGACAGVKEDLGACLLQSNCVLQVARPTGALRLITDAETGKRAGEGVPGGHLRPSRNVTQSWPFRGLSTALS